MNANQHSGPARLCAACGQWVPVDPERQQADPFTCPACKPPTLLVRTGQAVVDKRRVKP